MGSVTLESSKQSPRHDIPSLLVDSASDQCATVQPRSSISHNTEENMFTIHQNETQPNDELFVMKQLKRATVDIRFEGVSYAVSQGRRKEPKPIIKSVSGEFRSGELTAIMGPSGAGKSTMMNILAGFTYSNVTGDILINGEERDLRRFRKMSCYIMQRDELRPQLSVLELMNFASSLKMGNQMSPTEREELVNRILETIGLDHVGNTKTIHLSGGQKKRLAIALELINNPPVMFFDEPTSGLDSSSCLQCISLLKSLARGGRTVICVIHQPSSSLFEMFDQLYLMAEGQCIYRGPTTGVANFISTAIGVPFPDYHSQCDFAIDVASGIHGYQIDKLVNAVLQSDRNCWLSAKNRLTDSSRENGVTEVGDGCIQLSIESLAVPKRAKDPVKPKFNTEDISGSSKWSQLVILTGNTTTCILRDKTLTFVRIMINVVFGLLVGLLYLGVGNNASKVFNNIGFIIYGQLFLVATSMMLTTMTFPLEMPVLRREQLNNWYSLKMYYLAKSLADVPFQVFFTVLFVIPVYFLADQPHDAMRLFMYTLIGTVVSFVAQSVGLIIGAALPLQASVFLAPVSAVPLFLFSGFFVTFSTIPSYLRWICYVVYVRYGFEGSMVAIYGDDRHNLDCPTDFCHLKTPSKVLKIMDMEDANYWVDFGVLVFIYFAIRLLAYFVLRWKLKSQE